MDDVSYGGDNRDGAGLGSGLARIVDEDGDNGGVGSGRIPRDLVEEIEARGVSE